MGMEEGARNVGAQVGEPIRPTCDGIIVAAVVCFSQGAHAQGHDGYLCHRCGKFKFSHGAVSPEVFRGIQALRNVEGVHAT